MEHYDVIIIGGGPGGYVAAIETAKVGLKTALIEKESLGGVCLNYGCIPSKSLLKNAEIARTLRKDAKTFGISFSDLHLDYGEATRRSRKVSKRLNQGVAFLMKKHNITVIYGAASFSGKRTLLVKDAEGNESCYGAEKIIIAAGTSPVEIPGMAPDGKNILNYRQAILQETLPKSVVIIGGGAIGVEFATIWNAYGVDVSIVEMQSHLIPNEDSDAGAELERAFKKQGIHVYTGTSLNGIERVENGVTVHLKSTVEERFVNAEQVLIAVGFRPNSAALNLENAGVSASPRGWIMTDDFCRTNIAGIYAIGDITGKILLAHAASEMGRIAAADIAGKAPAPFSISLIPHATYSHPQVASFGITENCAIQSGAKIRVKKAGFIANGKALGISENEGWAKLICDAETDELLGATIVGPEVSELLPELTLASANGLKSETIGLNVHAHPTLSEILMEAASMSD